MAVRLTMLFVRYCLSVAALASLGVAIVSQPLNRKPSEVAHESLDGSPKRDHVGEVVYGGPGIFQCENPGQIAVTFDDGPSPYTKSILDAFDELGFKATFFMTGLNGGRQLNDSDTAYPNLLRRMIRDGHQIGSHGWRHFNLELEAAENTTVKRSSESRRAIITENENAIGQVLGMFPTYMRPPFAVCRSGDTGTPNCQDDMAQLGYHITQFNLDTKDYMYNSPTAIQNAIDRFDSGLDPSGLGSYIVLNHDIKEHTARELVPHMLKKIVEYGYKAVTVGECLNDPRANWYRYSSWP